MLEIVGPSTAEIEGARVRIGQMINRIPLLRLQHDRAQEIYLKLELLQPVGSFKVRCAANALMCMSDAIRRMEL